MSRAGILKNIRANIGEDKEAREQAVAQRLERKPQGVLPMVPAAKAKRTRLFMDKVEAAQASVEEISAGQFRNAVARWLREHNLPAEIRVGDDGRLAKLLSRGRAPLTILAGRSNGQELAGLSHAECGISESGTLVLVSGPDNPTTLNFLPENHLVVVSRADIAGCYEEIWPLLHDRYGGAATLRTVNLITGPSRSADIEQTLILGAHGPVRLHVIIVRE